MSIEGPPPERTPRRPQPLRWAVTGCLGQLGTWLVRDLEADPAAELAVANDYDTLDIADADAVAACLTQAAPDALVNAAAFNAVDAAEADDRVAVQVNEQGPRVLAEVARRLGARFAHVSTDYVFDGRGRRPYREDDPTGPVTAYGKTKLAGEQAVLACSPDFLVVRTSWVFGPGRNFVGAILRQAELRRAGRAEGPLRVVADQTGCPTYAHDLARALRQLVEQGARGLYHFSNAEPCTWWDFARAILDESGHGELAIDRATTEEMAFPAARPRFSVMDCGRIAGEGVPVRPWREALVEYLESADGEALRASIREEIAAAGQGAA